MAHRHEPDHPERLGMRTSLLRTGSQRGETLIESLVAITVLSIFSVAMFTGIGTALKASAMHHEIAVAETLLRSAAEQLQNPDHPYLPLAGCPGHDTYTDLPTRTRFSPVSTTIRFWQPAGSPTPQRQTSAVIGSRNGATSKDGTISFATADSCPSDDPGLQEITLDLKTPSGHLQTLTILKRQQ